MPTKITLIIGFVESYQANDQTQIHTFKDININERKSNSFDNGTIHKIKYKKLNKVSNWTVTFINPK